MDKRVLFTCNSGGLGHATRTLCIAKYLREKDDRIEIQFGGHGPGMKMVEMNGFEWHDLPQAEFFPIDNLTPRKMFGPYIANRKKYFDLFRNYRPDVHFCDMELFSLVLGKIYAKHNFLLSHEFEPFKFEMSWFANAMRSMLINFKDFVPEKTFYTWFEDMKLSPRKKFVGPLAFEEPVKKLGGNNRILVVISGAAKGIFDSVDFKSLGEEVTLYSRGVDIEGSIKIPKCPNLFPYVKAVDLVICSGWSTIMEALIANTPCLIIPCTGEQVDVAERCTKRGFADMATKENINQKINEMLFDKVKRKKLVESSSMLDNGAKEIAEYIYSVLK